MTKKFSTARPLRLSHGFYIMIMAANNIGRQNQRRILMEGFAGNELTDDFANLLHKIQEMGDAYREMAHGKFTREQWDEYWHHKMGLQDAVILLGRKVGAFDPADAVAPIEVKEAS